ncbi:DUF2254 domain-containing protein [Flavobacterium sp.]|uniref:DUF2254 domain-containing protein n=1 Tax=Flavobacterium sp. TaxID=239 RepID=UPI00261C7FF3|nr:DUF2254 domain-containing protein [Flavobacterium sp.]
MQDIAGRLKFWIRYKYNRIVNSIAFYPAFISLIFLISSILLISFDFSDYGKQLKSQLPWLSLRDASTARNIIGVVAAGILSLTVFSFSMVMIVLNQAASQMSNRVLNKLIGNRFQQIVLGIYIGTIVFALFLLTTIRDLDEGIYIPAISTYLLIVVAIFDIFVFIYFLHYITQSVKYEVIIHRIYTETYNSLKHRCKLEHEPEKISDKGFDFIVESPSGGVYEGFDMKSLLKICKAEDLKIFVLNIPGTYVLQGIPLIKVNKAIKKKEIIEDLQSALLLNQDETISNNFFYGLRQLTEVAVKALSPGINDPGTASIALRSLFRLFTHRFCLHPENVLTDDDNIARIYITEPDFTTIFDATVLPIWDYGKNDRIIQNEMSLLLKQFLQLYRNDRMENFLKVVIQQS